MSDFILPEVNTMTLFSLVGGGSLLNKVPLDQINEILNILNSVKHTLMALQAALALAGQPPNPIIIEALSIINSIINGPLGHIISYMEDQFNSFIKNLTIYAEHTKVQTALGNSNPVKEANNSLNAFGSICGGFAKDIALIQQLIDGITSMSPDKILNVLNQLLPIMEKMLGVTVNEKAVQDNMMAVLVNLQQARSYAEHIQNPVLQPIMSLAGTQTLQNLVNTTIDQNIRNIGFVPPSVASKLKFV